MQSRTHQLGNYLLLHIKTLFSEKVQVTTEFIMRGVYEKFAHESSTMWSALELILRTQTSTKGSYLWIENSFRYVVLRSYNISLGFFISQER